MKKRRRISIITVLLIIFIISLIALPIAKKNTEIKSIKSERQLEKIAQDEANDVKRILLGIVTLPFSLFDFDSYFVSTYSSSNYNDSDVLLSDSYVFLNDSDVKDYSTTNIQVENVDEADITKTDGDYIYSLSNDSVVITNVKDVQNLKVEATINARNSDSAPVDLILNGDKLVVISDEIKEDDSNTLIDVYDITDKASPKLLKDYRLYEKYYTSRCIDGKLYVISTGDLRMENDEVIRHYDEDEIEKDIALSDIKYLKDVKTRAQTLISYLNLNNIDEGVDVDSYLMDISNAYISEKNIYLLNKEFYNGKIPINKVFGLKGIFGVEDIDDQSTQSYTQIYKFNIEDNGRVKYSANTETKGKIINQYSLDEKDGDLRVALYCDDGSRVVVFDEKLNEIGASKYVAKGDDMYSSRFMGNRAYLFTIRTTEPLYVIDLSDESKPKVLGKLNISGFSTYLQPYDENHLIGFGMETGDKIIRDINGRISSIASMVTGMKIGLIDVSDVSNPTLVSQVVIGDSKTSSAILSNPKALLFSKEKELIAIPVRGYDSDFVVPRTYEQYNYEISVYQSSSERNSSEGYAVYSINLEDGINLRGIVTNNIVSSNNDLIRGAYIDNNLFTISQKEIKVSDIATLNLISSLELN